MPTITDEDGVPSLGKAIEETDTMSDAELMSAAQVDGPMVVAARDTLRSRMTSGWKAPTAAERAQAGVRNL